MRLEYEGKYFMVGLSTKHTQKYDLLQLGFESVVQESDNVFCDNQAGGISLLIRQILLGKKIFIATTRNIIRHIYSLEV